MAAIARSADLATATEQLPVMPHSRPSPPHLKSHGVNTSYQPTQAAVMDNPPARPSPTVHEVHAAATILLVVGEIQFLPRRRCEERRHYQPWFPLMHCLN